MATKKRNQPESEDSFDMPNPPESSTSSQVDVSTSANLSDISMETSCPSAVDMRSNVSMYEPIVFAYGEKQSSQMDVSTTEDPSDFSTETSSSPGPVDMKSNRSMFRPIMFDQGKKRRLETKEPSSCPEDISDQEAFNQQHEDTEEYAIVAGENQFLIESEKLKKAMQDKFTMTHDGLGDQRSPLKSIYTKLFITTGGSGDPDPEHTLRHVKRKVTRLSSSIQINLENILKLSPHKKKRSRVVLTKGVAGIGKSFAVQKVVLDWAEGKYKDVAFIFCLAFRELNLSRDQTSLEKLLSDFHPTLHKTKYIETGSVIVILDGLDESRFQLDFESEPITSITEESTLSHLLANLIQGKLLPDAQVWITSRPAAADQIPAEFVDLVSEIRGFSEPQKEEYFRRRYSGNPSMAERIISHIQSSQSLDIMCQIPIFCWISAVLFEEIFGGEEKAETPQTLTEMMAYLVVAQTVRRSRKYDNEMAENRESPLKTHKEFLLKLGKLAFVQLVNNSLVFYDEDLVDCGIGVEEATIYSGFCNAILREEKVFSHKKVFFFVHLTIQEFFAALFVYESFTKQKTEDLKNFLDLKDEEHSLVELLKITVDKILEEKNRHLDFFLQFLLGLMVEANQRVLQGLLTPVDPSQDTDKKVLTYLKGLRRKSLSPDSCISLFQTMVEMRDSKVKDEISEYLRLSDRSKTELTPLHCSALAYMLQVSKTDLEVLDLKSYNTTEEGRRRLIPAVRSSRKAILADCEVTVDWIEHLSFTLKFAYSALRDLDLSNNDLWDSGVKQLYEGLSNQCCRLKTLSLSGCLVSDTGCAFLASALQANPSHLMELDLSYNNPGEEGKKLLFYLINDPKYKLSKLSVDHDGSRMMTPGIKKYACELTLDPETNSENLLLSEQSVVGRCYWEVEMSGPASVGVTYREEKKPNIGDQGMGHNGNSWCLVCTGDGYYALHNNERVGVATSKLRSARVGVYLDWPAGSLSFYRVSSESRIRLHTFKTMFREPLYAAVELYPQSSALFVNLLD